MTHKEQTIRRAKMTAELARGIPIREVAIKYNVAYDTARKASRLLDRTPKSRVRLIELIAELLNTKDSLQQIADRLTLDYFNVARVYRRCVAAGIKLEKRKRGRPLTSKLN